MLNLMPLTDSEKKKANSYISSGGAILTRSRATAIAQHYGYKIPRHGYETILAEDNDQKLILMHVGGELVLRVWTSVNSFGMLRREKH